MKALLAAKALSFPDCPPPPPVEHEPAPAPEIEEKNFQEAMEGVTPI